jgi:hypothetical protein
VVSNHHRQRAFPFSELARSMKRALPSVGTSQRRARHPVAPPTDPNVTHANATIYRREYAKKNVFRGYAPELKKKQDGHGPMPSSRGGPRRTGRWPRSPGQLQGRSAQQRGGERSQLAGCRPYSNARAAPASYLNNRGDVALSHFSALLPPDRVGDHQCAYLGTRA